MNPDLRRIVALTAAGLLWGTTVPLSKVALEWLPPGWLTFARFAVAATILLVAARSRVPAAWSPAVLAWGAVGYGGSVLVQNAGIVRTSVSHAALLIGATPVLVAIVAALWRRTVARPLAWAGFAVSLAGVGLVAGRPGGGATVSGDGLVLMALLMSAIFTVAQTGLLRGRDPVAVTAVQFLGAALASLPVAVVTEGVPPAPSGAATGTILAFAGLALGGTLLPFTLFAYGQSRVSAEVAGAFLNLEPLVGALAGIVLFGNPAGPEQILGGAAILAGIALGSLPLLSGRRSRVVVKAVTTTPVEPGLSSLTWPDRAAVRHPAAALAGRPRQQSLSSRGPVTRPARCPAPSSPAGPSARPQPGPGSGWRDAARSRRCLADQAAGARQASSPGWAAGIPRRSAASALPRCLCRR